MTSRTTRRFRGLFTALPLRIQQQAKEAYRLFKNNSEHPSLRFKQVHSDPPTFSVRVGISYRAVGAKNGEVITWFWIGSHADYEKLLKLM
jgi:hypothetical protein